MIKRDIPKFDTVLLHYWNNLRRKYLKPNSNRHKRVEVWAKSIKDFMNLGCYFPCATSAKILAACTRVCRKIVPYHGVNLNTRNDARLRSPSPIMAPAEIPFTRASILELFRGTKTPVGPPYRKLPSVVRISNPLL